MKLFPKRRHLAAAGLLVASLSLTPAAMAQQDTVAPTDYANTEPLGAAMEGWASPAPVHMLQFEMQGQLVRMA